MENEQNAKKRSLVKEIILELHAGSQFPTGVKRLVYLSKVDNHEDWALIWPPKESRPDAPTTWVISLHGHGGTGDQIYTRQDVRKHRLDAFRKEGWGILTPNLRGNAWMCPAAVEDLHSMLEYLRKKFNADRFVFFSGSMGGTGNLIYGVLHPEDVAACVSLSPVTDLPDFEQWCTQRKSYITESIDSSYEGKPSEKRDLYQRHSAFANMDKIRFPVLITHGDADDTVPVEQSRRFAEKAKNFKFPFEYIEIPKGGHDAALGIPIEKIIGWTRPFLKK